MFKQNKKISRKKINYGTSTMVEYYSDDIGFMWFNALRFI